MATRWAVANGNWSDTATWDGGTLPTSADDVYADSRTVTIDQDITVLSLRTTARSGGVAGGGFTTAGQFNATATGTGIVPGTTTCLTYTGNVTVTVTANCAASSNLVWGVLMSGASANLTVNGNLTGSSSTSAAVYLSGDDAVVTVVGNIQGGGAGTTAYGLYMTGASAQATATGLITGWYGGSAIAMTGIDAVASVTGNVVGALANNGQGINMSGVRAQLSVVGNVEGRANHGVYMSSTSAQATITGNVVGGNTGGGMGVWMAGAASLVTITGSVIGLSTGGLSFGVRSDATASGFGVVVSGSITDSIDGVVAIWSRMVRMNENAGTTTYANNVGFPGGTPLVRVSPSLATGVPAASDVRSGVTYGFTGSVTGTLAVPPTDSVAAGVPVDNTVGTAAVRLADIAAITGAQIAAALST